LQYQQNFRQLRLHLLLLLAVALLLHLLLLLPQALASIALCWSVT
jgi:hypothetical protein